MTGLNQTQDDVATMRTALDAARHGGASVDQLAHAHELAEKHRLPTVTQELRRHIRHLIPDPDFEAKRFDTIKILILGVTSGICTHLLLRFGSLHRHR